MIYEDYEMNDKIRKVVTDYIGAQLYFDDYDAVQEMEKADYGFELIVPDELDTNNISYFVKNHPESKRIAFGIIEEMLSQSYESVDEILEINNQMEDYMIKWLKEYKEN